MLFRSNDARSEATDADLKITLLGMDLETDLMKRRQAHRLGDKDFTDEALGSLKTSLEKLQYNEQGEESFTTSYGQRTFATKAAHLAKTYSAALGRVQADIQGADAVETFNQLTAAHSNRVSLGQNYLSIVPTLQEYEQSIRTGVFENMPANKREELLRQGKGVIANSAVDGLIRDNPRGALSALQGGFLSDVLTKDQTSTLLDKAQTGVHMQEVREQQASARLEHATELASQSQYNTVGMAYLTDISSPNYNPYDTMDKILALMSQPEMNNLTAKQIIPMIGTLQADIRELKSGAKEGNFGLSRKLFSKIVSGEITDITEINTARSGVRPNPNDPAKVINFDPISASQHEELIKEFNDYRTPDGRSLQKEKAEFEKLIGPQILHPGPFGIYEDATTGAQMQRYINDLNVRIAQYRKAGKNPYDLFDPAKPDYFGAPAIVDKYQNKSFGSLSKPAPAVTDPTKPRKSLEEIFGVKK